MDFTYPQEAEAFRKEFRAWLDGNLSEDLRELAQHPVGDDPERIERLKEWNRTLADARYAAIAWPPEYGGRGASLMEQVVYAEEMHRATLCAQQMMISEVLETDRWLERL